MIRCHSTPRKPPHPATPFIGRAAELAEIGVLLDDPACRLLTLTGPGGIGKARLALASAAERADRYPHGVWFVNLAPLSSADGVVSAIADTFKLSGLGVVDPKQALQNYLREKALLLVLDNFEHVLDAAESVADLFAAPGVQVLVTSRERLRLRAERVYEVRALPVPLNAAQADADTFDALRLFVACVRHSHPQHTLGPADTVAVAQICRMAASMPQETITHLQTLESSDHQRSWSIGSVWLERIAFPREPRNLLSPQTPSYMTAIIESEIWRSPNQLAFSCRKRAVDYLQHANDLGAKRATTAAHAQSAQLIVAWFVIRVPRFHEKPSNCLVRVSPTSRHLSDGVHALPNQTRYQIAGFERVAQ